MLPMRTLLDLLHKFRPHKLRSASDGTIRFRPQIQTFHQIVSSFRQWIVELTSEQRWSDQSFKLRSFKRPRMNDRNSLYP